MEEGKHVKIQIVLLPQFRVFKEIATRAIQLSASFEGIFNIRNIQTCMNFDEFIGAKLPMIARKQNLNGLRKCSRKWQFYHLFYTTESEGKM